MHKSSSAEALENEELMVRKGGLPLRDECLSIMTGVNHPSDSVLISVSLCNLCVLCASVVNNSLIRFTTETQRTQRTHRD